MVSVVGSSQTSGDWSCLSAVDDFGIGGTQPPKTTVSFFSWRPNRVTIGEANGLVGTRPIISTVFLGTNLGTRYFSGEPYYTSS
jgi:hypothetical protein